MKKHITLFCLALAFTSCSTDNKKSLTVEQTRADSTATALAKSRSMVAKSVALLDSMDGTKTPTPEQLNAEDAATTQTKLASGQVAFKNDDLVGEYAIKLRKTGSVPAVRIEREYDDYYISLMVEKDQWLPRERLVDMDVNQVAEDFGTSAHYFLELAMISESGKKVYKVKKGMKYDGHIFDTSYVLGYSGLQQLYKLN